MPPATPQPIRRIRIADSFDERGRKKVWHSSGAGADLVSEVDKDGKPVFQELTIGPFVTEWTPERGIRSAYEEETSRKVGRANAAHLVFRQPPMPEALHAAVSCVDAATDDLYLRHFREQILKSLGALESSGVGAVTGALPETPLPPPLTWWDRLRRTLFP